MVLLPLAEVLWRSLFKAGVPGSGPFVQHLTLVVGYLGAALAAREGRLLALATGTFIPEGRLRRAAQALSAAVGAAVSTLLCRAGLEMALIEKDAGTVIAAGVPVWLAQLVLPLSFGLIALRLMWRASPGWGGRAFAALGIVAGAALGQLPQFAGGRPPWPGLALVLLGTALGGPLFVLLGGIAVLFFLRDGVPLAAVTAETYRLAVNPTLAAVPLFTLAGFLLSEGRASQRLLRVFRALVGWVPGGTAVVCLYGIVARQNHVMKPSSNSVQVGPDDEQPPSSAAAGVPVWLAQLVLPLSFGAPGDARLAAHAGHPGLRRAGHHLPALAHHRAARDLRAERLKRGAALIAPPPAPASRAPPSPPPAGPPPASRSRCGRRAAPARTAWARGPRRTAAGCARAG